MKDNTMYDTAILPDLNLEDEKMPPVKLKDIQENDAAFTMLVNLINSRDRIYSDVCRERDRLKEENTKLVEESKNRKTSTILITVANIITSIGVGFLINNLPAAIVGMAAGITMNAVGLWLSFRR